MAEEEGAHEEKKEEQGGEGPESKRLMNYPLIKFCDMPDEMRTEAMESVVTALEKFPAQYESSAKMMKENLDKKFGPSWNAIVGEGFGFDMHHSVKHLLFVYYGGTVAVLVYKAI